MPLMQCEVTADKAPKIMTKTVLNCFIYQKQIDGIGILHARSVRALLLFFKCCCFNNYTIICSFHRHIRI